METPDIASGVTREMALRAVASKDARFDGSFFSAVLTTGIYCRPSCPAAPLPKNLTFYPSAAAAQLAGFRACKRCRPDATPGSAAWDVRADVAARAVRLIADGVVDRDGVTGLAARLGYSERQVERVVTAELGAGPLALARAQRAQTARVLLEGTTLQVGDVALAAGFASIRQFNDTVRSVFASTPTSLRGGRSAGSGTALDLRLPFRAPLHAGQLFGHLAATAVPGVEEWRDGAYRRTLHLPHGHGIVRLTPPCPGQTWVDVRLHLTDLRDLAAATARCRRLLDLDADPVAVDAVLAQDPFLFPLVTAVPGRRVPRTVDGAELAVRAVLGQQVSTAAARTHAARLVTAFGTPVIDAEGGLTHLFPTPSQLGDAAPAFPKARLETFRRVVAALASYEVDLRPGSDPVAALAAFSALKGIGPWTAGTVAMRALGDPDAFLPGDLGVVRAAQGLGITSLAARSERWAPWRAYAVQHLWGYLPHSINRLPTESTDLDASSLRTHAPTPLEEPV